MTTLIRLFSLSLLLLFTTGFMPSAGATEFEQRTYTDAQGQVFPFTLSFPEGYSTEAEQKYPVILFLHGAGERGTDGVLPSHVGLGAILRQDEYDLPAVVVYPQCSDADSRLISGWLAEGTDAKRAIQILDQVIANEHIDANKQILIGWSMGGYGAWSVGAATADRWSAIIPLAGGGKPSQIEQLKQVPVWAFHGQRDMVVPSSESQQMVDALKQAGGNVQFTLVPNAGHDIWRYVFDKKPFREWLKQPEVAASTSPITFDQPALGVHSTGTIPYSPQGKVDGLMTISLSNAMVSQLLASEVSQFTSKPLQGSIANISISQSVQGYPFTATFANISYSGNIRGAQLQAIGDDLVKLDILVSSIQLRIGGTSIRGNGLKQARTGPTSIMIGQRSPLNLSITARINTNSNGQLQLQQVSTDFRIPSNNYYVTRPAVYLARGLGVTPDRVSNGIVQGLYSSRSRIESEVRQVVPSILSQVQQSLNSALQAQSRSTIALDEFWPLPTYAPRLKPSIGELHCNTDGFSLSLDAEVFTTSPASSQSNPIVTANSSRSTSIDTSSPLQVSLSLDAFGQLTQLADLQGAMIDLRDIPGQPLKTLSEQATLKQLAGDQGTEKLYRGLLQLNSGLQLHQQGESLTVAFPDVSLMIGSKAPHSKRWEKVSTFTMDLSQPFTIALQQTEDGIPGISARPAASIAVQVKSQATDQANQTLASLFQKGWDDWLQNRGPLQSLLPDLKLSGTTLRASQLQRSGSQIALGFEIPKVTLVNRTDQPFRFQLRTSNQSWGELIQLASGERHTFASALPTGYRLEGDEQIRYLLPVGFQGEYRPSLKDGSVHLFQSKAYQNRQVIEFP